MAPKDMKIEELLDRYEFETEPPHDAMKWTTWSCIGHLLQHSSPLKAIDDDEACTYTFCGKSLVFHHFHQTNGGPYTLQSYASGRLCARENGFFSVGMPFHTMAIFKPGQVLSFHQGIGTFADYAEYITCPAQLSNLADPPRMVTTGFYDYAVIACGARPRRPTLCVFSRWPIQETILDIRCFIEPELFHEYDHETEKKIRQFVAWSVLRRKASFVGRLARALSAWYAEITITPPHGQAYIQAAKRFRQCAEE